MQESPLADKSPLKFFLLVFIFSVPFWVIGLLIQVPQESLINLPVSSLMIASPLVAALILTYKEDKSAGVKVLIKRAFYRKGIKKRWYLPIILLMPVMMFLAYLIMLVLGMILPAPIIPLSLIVLLVLPFFVGAFAEEVGWLGYAIDPMQNRWGALKASILLGSVWALWHLLPYIQTGNGPEWIIWQSLGSLPLRILIVWLYNNTQKAILAGILFHTTINVSEFSFPNYGSHYDPFISGIIFALVAAIVTLLWGPKTLARYRFT